MSDGIPVMSTHGIEIATPSSPSQTYKVLSISEFCNCISPLSSTPIPILIPPAAQFEPAGSVLVVINELIPAIPVGPAGP